MKKRLNAKIFSVTIAIFLLAVTVTGAFAAPPLDVHIEVHEVLSNGTFTAESFTASGAAVGNGVICATGTVIDLVGASTFGAPDAPFTIINAMKRFTCEGKGTFDVKLVVQLEKATGNTTANWRIVGGTGDYAGLRGSGSLVGTAEVLGSSVFDVYDGFVH